MPTVSVIIPVYNTSPYLLRCLASVLDQTHRDLEVILVDDGSTDASPTLCDEYADKDARIKVIHQENGGLSAARNAGLELACGDYIGFVDSDDWIELDMYAYLIDLMEHSTSDVAEIMFEVAYSEAHTMRLQPEKKALFEGDEILIHYFEHNEYAMGLRLYKRELFEKVRFDVGRMNEDVVAGFLVLSHAQRLAVSNQTKYFYFSNPAGLSESSLRKRDFDLLYSGERLDELTSTTANAAIRKLALIKRYRAPFTLLIKMALFGCSEELNEKQVKRQLQEAVRSKYRFLMASNMPFNRKLLLTVSCVSYPLVKFMAAGYRTIRGREA